jgi:hypothetical protein
MATKKPAPKDKQPEILARKAVNCESSKTDPEVTAQIYAALVISPELAAYRVINGAEHSSMKDRLDVPSLVQALKDQGVAANRNDLSQVEAMLMNQATALQTLFCTHGRTCHGCGLHAEL